MCTNKPRAAKQMGKNGMRDRMFSSTLHLVIFMVAAIVLGYAIISINPFGIFDDHFERFTAPLNRIPLITSCFLVGYAVMMALIMVAFFVVGAVFVVEWFASVYRKSKAPVSDAGRGEPMINSDTH